jgi:CRISPR-associated protein Csa3
MSKVLIATLYSPNPVLLSATKISAERLILLIDKTPDKEQKESLKIISDSLGRVMEVKTVKIDVYDIIKTATKCVEIIDLTPKDDEVYINITSGRKTVAIGLLFAAYARSDRIKKIAYNTEEDENKVIYLPKLTFNLTESQIKVLEYISEGNFKSLMDLSNKIDISRGMLYRNVKELKDLNLIDTDDGIKLTDAGKIARL